MLPEDIILNTRRAFGTSATSPTGYGALGAPEGRYLAPANSENCIELAAGDCTPRTLLVRAPWFVRVDIGMTKRFPVKGDQQRRIARGRVEPLRQHQLQPGGEPRRRSAPSSRWVPHTSDTVNNFDPGGRLGQLSFRFNW